MKSGVYDVTLYWHDGGSLFLGTVALACAALAAGLEPWAAAPIAAE